MKLSIPCSSVASLISFALLSASCQKKPEGNPMAMMMAAVPVRAVAATATDVPLLVSAVGNVESVKTVDVKSRVAGQIVRVDFREGQDVQAGELLFEIDPEPLHRQIAELQANIAKDEALELQARANVTKDQAQLTQSRAAADRGLELSKDGIFSKEQTEQVVATADAAQASLEADRAAAVSASAAKKADNAKLAETALQLQYTKITAPISGRAGAIAIQQGNLVKDNDVALVTLLQISPIYVSFGVPEQVLPDVRKFSAAGKSLSVAATGADGQISTGKLQFIDNTVDTTTGTVKLKALFTNEKRALWPGQFVNVQAQLQLEHDRILIPSRTLQTGPDGKYVWVMNPSDATVTMRPITVLRLYQANGGPEQAVVSTGLRSGEMVISEGQMRLAPGAKVRLLEGGTQLGQTESGQTQLEQGRS